MKSQLQVLLAGALDRLRDVIFDRALGQFERGRAALVVDDDFDRHDAIENPDAFPSASSTSCSVAVISARLNWEVRVTSAPWREAA